MLDNKLIAVAFSFHAHDTRIRIAESNALWDSYKLRAGGDDPPKRDHIGEHVGATKETTRGLRCSIPGSLVDIVAI